MFVSFCDGQNHQVIMEEALFNLSKCIQCPRPLLAGILFSNGDKHSSSCYCFGSGVQWVMNQN